MQNVSMKTALCLISAAMLGAPGMYASAVDVPNFKVMGLVVVWGADGASPTSGAPIVSDFVIDTGTGANAATSGDADLIDTDVHTVLTGSLDPVEDGWASGEGSPFRLRQLQGTPNFVTDTNNDGVMDASDAFGAFQLRQNSDVESFLQSTSSFYVASNSAFNIDATATALNGTTAAELNNMRLRLRTHQTGDDGLAFGSSAQHPHSGGAAGGSQANNRRLSTMTSGRRVFQGDRRTALTPGSLADQSVRFDLRYRYTGNGRVDLSLGTFEVEAEVVYTVYMP